MLDSTSAARDSAMPGLTTARRHLYAWYSYAFAAEVFSACAMAIFLPITLEQMAREIGFLAPDLVVPCAEPGDEQGVICKAKILGAWVDSASFSMYVKSVAVAVQALAIICIGPLADAPYWRKKLLLLFAYTGASSGICLLFFPSQPSSWIPVVTAALTIIGNVGYATSIVCANAFLPGLAREHPSVAAAKPVRYPHHAAGTNELDTEDRPASLDDTLATHGEGQALLHSALDSTVSAISTADLAHVSSSPRALRTSMDDSTESYYAAKLSLMMSRISSTGTAIGFFSGVAVLALLIIPVTIGGGSTASLRLTIGLAGIWWAVFTVPAGLGLPGGAQVAQKDRDGGWMQNAWGRIARMVTPTEVKRLPNLFCFLLAWIFLSDGFHTTTYTAILYASSTLRMTPSRIIIIGVLVQLAAVVSSIYTPKYQRRRGYTNLAVLLRIVVLALILPVYTCVGLILPFGGLRIEGEMYVAATWFGLLYGPFNSYSRAVYAELIPPGHESSFFSLFALTDKSASFLGPFVVGFIADKTGNIRLGFIFLLLMLVIPIPVLLRVRMGTGRDEAKAWTNSSGSPL